MQTLITSFGRRKREESKDDTIESSLLDKKKHRRERAHTEDEKRIDSTTSEEDELENEVLTLEKPTTTTMAKLFQDDKFDAYESFASVWPRPKSEGSDVVPYAAVADTLADISAVNSRLECVKLLTNLLRAVIKRDIDSLVPVIYLIINKQAPAHEGVELGIGDALLVKVVAEVCGMTEAHLKSMYKSTGDLAELAQMNKKKQSTLVQPKALTAKRVFQLFKEIAKMSGNEVMQRRADIVKRLLRDAVGPEVNLIVRALQQKMRIGLAEPSALSAVGYAFALHHIGTDAIRSIPLDELQSKLNLGGSNFTRIYYEVPSIEVVTQAVIKHGFLVLVPSSSVAIANESQLGIRPGIPVKPQLAHPTSGISFILARFEGKKFTSEYKYDGERAQIHYSKEAGFSIFSRNSETHTGKYPDVVAALPTTFDRDNVTSFIIDSEIVAVHPETGELQAFQVLQHRGRKNIKISDVTIPVCVFVFDILYLNGHSVLRKTLRERRELLRANFVAKKGVLDFASHLDADNVEAVENFMDESVANGCEGLMIKTLDEEATYTPAKRSHYWLKLKKDYMDGATDTFDLVPIGAFYGKGKRAGIYGAFLLACYDPENDEYQSICKLGTGFQEELLQKITDNLRGLALSEKPRYFRAEGSSNGSGGDPDVWFNPSQVWEVKAADLTVSPVHFAAYGLVDPTRGIALRFPRFIRIREDKGPTDCTSSSQIAEMYRSQSLALKPDQNQD